MSLGIVGGDSDSKVGEDMTTGDPIHETMRWDWDNNY